jgi:hypothetical protein
MEQPLADRRSQHAGHTIEFELSASGVRKFATTRPVASHEDDVVKPHKAVWTARKRILAAIAPTLVMLASIAYLVARPSHRVATTASTSTREAPVGSPQGATVRFANPFDSDEKFEIAPGTTEEAARAAVAEILFRRAQEREPPAAKGGPTRKSAKTKNTLAAENSRRP